MQKISTYLYPNRIELLADLAGFTVEYTNVYQRNIKIYNGIDNTLEFDIKNPDQKRIDLSTVTQIELNIMDIQGNALPNSPYAVTPLNQTTKKGLATVTIPQDDLVDLDPQFLQFSVSALQGGKDLLLYGDTRFGAVGKMELVGNAMPTFRNEQVITSFFSDMSFNTIESENFHSSAIPVRFYEAVPTTDATIEFNFDGLEAEVIVEATTDASISSESFPATIGLRPNPDNKPPAFRRGTVIDTFTITTANTLLINNYSNLGEYTYLRISYHRTYGNTGKITKVLVS
jgi:hypothetical protein